MSVYRGRFAPSPTGPLHFGSLVSAVGSFLQARSQNGLWLLRMEDVDQTRCFTQAADSILRTLEAYDLYWDESYMVQTQRSEAYTYALQQLHELDQVYACACSRKAIATHNQTQGHPPGFYAGLCRNGIPNDTFKTHEQMSVRVKVENQCLGFEDRVQGFWQQNLEQEVGDFVIRRADGLFAYQLAVVVDDRDQGITEIVRGSDLIDSTPRQCYLQSLLGIPSPDYIHLPVAQNAQGEKLSKQTHAPALPLERPVIWLWQALDFLGQQPPRDLQEADLDAFWDWAIRHWRLEQVPKVLGSEYQPFHSRASTRCSN